MSLIEQPLRGYHGYCQENSPWQIDGVPKRCRELWDSGESASRISIALEIEFDLIRPPTRNAVLGYVHREGFPHRHVVSSIPKQARVRKSKPRQRFMADFRSHRQQEPLTQAERGANAFRRRNKFAIIEIVDLPPEESAVAVSFLGLTDKNCHWPLGDPRDMEAMKFCGADHFDDKPYCLKHCRMAYVARADRKGA